MIECRLIVHKTPPTPGRRYVYLYSVSYEGETIVNRSHDDAACDAARALKARGIAGKALMLDDATGKPRYVINIEKAAKMTVAEGNADGPRFVKWRESQYVSSHSPESPPLGTGIPE